VTDVTPKRRADWRPVFLSIFRQTGIVALGCRGAGISRTQAYRERQQNARFADDWADAEEDATEVLEAEARRRAMSTSDTLLIFLFKARRPSVYRETIRVDLRREAETLAATMDGISADELIEEAERIARSAR
jgi:hypothetical protein